MLQKLRKKEYDASILGLGTEWKSDPFQLWHGSQADVPDSSNSIGYKNPEVDKLIDELRITLDVEQQNKLFHQIHRLIYEDQPYTFLFSDIATAGRDARIGNVKFYKIRPGFDTREWVLASCAAVADRGAWGNSNTTADACGHSKLRKRVDLYSKAVAIDDSDVVRSHRGVVRDHAACARRSDAGSDRLRRFGRSVDEAAKPI